MANRAYSAIEAALANPVIRLFSRINTWVYRLTGGRLGGQWMHGEPILLLTVTGRKTGRALTVPLVFMQDGERLLVVASKRGMDTHPLWYLNLVAHPDVDVQIKGATRPMRARTVDEAERTALWPRLVAFNKDYGDYQGRTQRHIPVVSLSPR